MKKITQTKVDGAVERVVEFLKSQISEDDSTKIKIYIWPEWAKFGIRVAEISFWIGNLDGTGVGSSFMQVDFPNGGVACFYTERLILAYLHMGENPIWDDDIRDDEYRLCHAIFGREPQQR